VGDDTEADPNVRGRVWPVASGVAWRTLHNVLTTPALLIPGILFPLFFFTAFAGGLSQVEEVPGFDYPGDYTSFQFVFVLLQAAAFGGVFTGFGIARDFEGGFGKRLLLASPNRLGILVGFGLAALVRWVITGGLLTVVAIVIGMDVGGSGVDIVGLYTLALLVNVCGLLWAAGIALRFRSIQAAPLMQMPVFLALFFAPVYVPLDLLSGWIETVATFNPVTYFLEAGRGLIAGDPTEVALAFGVAFALMAVLAVWGIRGLHRAEAAG
jgi:ABC-2 type transport system permease protein